MSDEDDPETENNIERRAVRDLASSIERCEGHFSFLIGAGSSSKGGIPTAGELVSEWREAEFRETKGSTDASDGEIREWAKEIESDEMGDNEGHYGFWFEKRYTTRGERRMFIREMVKDAEPTFGHIVLASMMEDNFVPLTLTPNFDDLLYDSFYLFIEEKPMMIDHHAIAPQFQLTQERPTIIKLHGDYLYDNLKNTDSETEELEKNMQKAVSRSLDEYGMVVVGYGGNDESIMGIMNSDDVDIPDYGLFWCKLKGTELSEKAKKLLKKPNTFLIEIDGFEELLSTLYSEIDGLNVPMPDEIRSRAEEREQMLMQKVAETEGTGSLELKMSADEYIEKGEYDSAIELLTKIIEQINTDKTKSIVDIYDMRALAHVRNGNVDQGIEDYNKTIELDETAGRYLNRAESLILNNEPEKAKEAIELAKKAEGDVGNNLELYLRYLIKCISGDDVSEEKEKLQDISEEGGIGGWEFRTIIECVDLLDVDDNTKENIEELTESIRKDYHVNLKKSEYEAHMKKKTQSKLSDVIEK